MNAPLHGSLVLSAALAAPLAAQDSVSNLFLPPGDAINAYDATDQINDYVVDMVATNSSWGNSYGVAPIVKGSITQGPFFTHLFSGNAVSRDTLSNVPFLRSSYDFWDAPGFGVSNTTGASNPGMPLDTSSVQGDQFSVAFSEFGGTASNVIGGVVNYDPEVPSRLYVSRVVGAVNGPDFGCDLSQFGFGGISASGVYAQRVDGFGSADSCGLTAITDQNYFEIDLAQRTGILNIISGTGAADTAASNHIVAFSTTTHVTPTMYTSNAGDEKVIGTTFGNEYVFENGAGTGMASSFAHIPAGVISSRGNISYTEDNFPSLLGSSVNGTSGLIGLNGNNEKVFMFVWGISGNGSPSGNLRLDLPAVLTDNSTGWMSNTLGGGGPLEFANVESQTSFRGGNGQVAIGADQQGRMITAAVVDHPNSNGGATNNGNQLIAVARTNSAGATDWTIAAHCDPSSGVAGTGKPLLDGPGGNVIGRLISFDTLTLGGQTGPSMTSPMIDSVGNIYFVAAVETFGAGGVTDPGSGLVRAVYNPVTFSYELELLFDTGTVLRGQNSDTDYVISFIQIADSNSIGSEAAFSGNMRGGAFNGLDPQSLDTTDPRTLGGIAMAVNIIYDADNDGDFEAATMGSLDESYRTMLYVAHVTDCNENGVADDRDLAEGTSTDLNNNGILDECEDSIGNNYCIATANSSGASANIAASGSTSVTANNLILIALPMATNQPGIFFYGPDQILVPFGNGFRCIGAGMAGVARLPVENGGPGGVLVHNLDNTMAPTTATQITAGSTWNFQAWFRDPVAGGANFNLSNGLEVTFTP